MPDTDDTEIDNFLAHYGVRGMRWGIRKEAYYTQNVSSMTSAQINKELEKVKKMNYDLDPMATLGGYGSRGGQAMKLYEKEIKKDPDYMRKMSPEQKKDLIVKFDKSLTPEEKMAFTKKIDRILVAKHILVGAAEVGVIMGGGLGALKLSQLSPNTKKKGAISVAGLAALDVKLHLDALDGIRQSRVKDSLRNQSRILDKELVRRSKLKKK